MLSALLSRPELATQRCPGRTTGTPEVCPSRSSCTLKRHSRGRPVKNEEPQYLQVYRINLAVGAPDEEALAQAKERLGCFVLISNVGHCNTSDVLKEYKEQTVVENRFKFIKHPIYAGPMFLQKIERMEALSYVILMALIVYIVLQRRVRRALEKEAEPLEITGGKKSFAPTGKKLLELLSPVKILCLKEGDVVIDRCLPKSYNDLSRLLTLIGFALMCLSGQELHKPGFSLG